MKNGFICGQVKYHAEFEKQKGKKTSVADDPETSRIKQNTQIQSNFSYWGVKDLRNVQEDHRPQNSTAEHG